MSTLPSAGLEQRRATQFWLLVLAILVVALDRISKIWVSKHVEMGSGITIVPHVFRITHVLNTGAAFSMFANSGSPFVVRIGLIVFSLLVTLGISFLLWRYGRTWTFGSTGLALILGGAIGNLYDRAVMHYVVDFLEVHIGSHYWPDFNIADSAISVGAVLLLVEMIWPHETVSTEGDIHAA